MITSDTALIYCYVLWLIGRRDFGIGISTLRSVMARWFFMAHTTGRYTGLVKLRWKLILAGSTH